MDKSYIILIHSFAADHLNNGFTYKEMVHHLAANKIDTGNESTNAKINKVLNYEIIFGDLNLGDSNARYFMTSEAYYRHLEYLEMKAAQENATEARKWAIAALVISGVLALAQVILTAIQITSNK